ncbi:hypothetical protein ACH5RR_004288 [Cinchona calisaya]|uniref:Apple domain-containing protein n=1 Tax=Cinchona calisaya TaxID=153742 RepID=A0ABD3AY13_9GENT
MFRQIGYFDGQSFRFFFQSASDGYNFTFVSNIQEVYLTFDHSNGNNMSWFVLTSTGEISEFTMLDQGVASIVTHTLCEGEDVGSTGCVIPMPSMCGDKDKFSEIKGSMPTSVVVYGSIRMGPSDCEIMCRNNCSCIAYSSFCDDGTGCELYYGSKWDLLYGIGKGNGIIHVRGDVSIISVIRGREDGIRESVSLLLYQFGSNTLAVNDGNDANVLELGKRKDPELPQLSFSCIVTATDNFSSASKIGEGGYGLVYKAWEMWQEGYCLDLMDQTLMESCLEDELILCIQVALLCVQENPKDRPTMSDIVQMLRNERTNLSIPKQPAFSTLSIPNVEQQPSSNDATFSEIEAR